MSTRRRRGEDGISFEHRGPCTDPHRHRHCPGLWRGELTTGYTGDGKRQRRKVSGKTKAAVIDKLRDLHAQLDKGVTPRAGYAHYTVRQAAETGSPTGWRAAPPRRSPRTGTSSSRSWRSSAPANSATSPQTTSGRPWPPWRPGTPPRLSRWGTWHSSGPSGTPKPTT